MNVKKLNSENFDLTVEQGRHVVFVGSEQCSDYTNKVLPATKELAKSNKGINIATSEFMDNDVPKMKAKYGITAVPATLFLQDGELKRKLEGIGGDNTRGFFQAHINAVFGVN